MNNTTFLALYNDYKNAKADFDTFYGSFATYETNNFIKMNTIDINNGIDLNTVNPNDLTNIVNNASNAISNYHIMKQQLITKQQTLAAKKRLYMEALVTPVSPSTN